MTPTQALVIGIGNRLRSDDGAGLQLAEAAAAENPALQVLLCAQPTPELAVAISQAKAVLFVDALVGDGLTRDARDGDAMSGTCLQPRLEPLQAASAGDPAGHNLTPAGLLALSTALYDTCPPAWLLLIPGVCWEVGDQLSPAAATACRRAMPLLRQWGAVHA